MFMPCSCNPYVYGGGGGGGGGVVVVVVVVVVSSRIVAHLILLWIGVGVDLGVGVVFASEEARVARVALLVAQGELHHVGRGDNANEAAIGLVDRVVDRSIDYIVHVKIVFLVCERCP